MIPTRIYGRVYPIDWGRNAGREGAQKSLNHEKCIVPITYRFCVAKCEFNVTIKRFSKIVIIQVVYKFSHWEIITRKAWHAWLYWRAYHVGISRLLLLMNTYHSMAERHPYFSTWKNEMAQKAEFQLFTCFDRYYRSAHCALYRASLFKRRPNEQNYWIILLLFLTIVTKISKMSSTNRKNTTEFKQLTVFVLD